jgi:ATP-dependent Lhr-like helicase
MTPRPTNDLPVLDQPPPADTALAALPQPLAHWFRLRFGTPTAAQRLAWPALAGGRHLLLSAPTGTGKTLAAFLPILEALLRQSASPQGGSALRCLYVAPLKALTADIARSLTSYLGDLETILPPGTPLPRLEVRTGDTPPGQRRRLRDDPPDLLLTTPESLAVLLSQGAYQAVFGNLRHVVVDEVHALAAGKRGADLALSLERLDLLAGGDPMQRIGLSATATPLAEAARYLVGPGRSCAIACASERVPPEIKLEPLPSGPRFLHALVARLARELPLHRSTLVFTNTRGLAERLGWALRRRLPAWEGRIAVHHSALAAARRREVEERFKAGELGAVISSTSLELGIDIGAVDMAVLVHPPGDVVRLLQRVGRAGHGPHALRRGLVLGATAAELLEGAVTAASGLAAQCEPLRVPRAPLDVLCQQILGMTAVRSWPPDELFELVRRAGPYAELTRGDFDACLAYLRGLDHTGQPWLPARLREDGDCFRIRDGRTARLLRRNLGTILAEEGVPVLLQAPPAEAPAPVIDEDDPFPGTSASAEDPARTVGTVAEAFSERLEPGDRFLLDGRCLEFRRREEGALLVEEVAGRPQVPRWGGDGLPMSAELARRLYVLRMQAAEALREGPEALRALLERDYGLSGPALDVLADYFGRQESMSEIPDTKTLLIEAVGREGGADYYLHTPLNRAGNDALARVAVGRLARQHGRSALSVVADLGFVLRLRTPLAEVPEVVRGLLTAEGFEAELEASLADSPALRARFGRVAQTGLMLLRNPLGGRRRVGGRDWGERRLFEQVRAHDPDFVLLRQARREVRAELCDAAAGRAFVEQVPGLVVRCRWLALVSPFVEAWTQPALGPAEAVETPAEALQRLHAQLTGGQDDASPG